MTQVNLLPPDVRGRQRTRQLTLIVAGVAVIAVVLLIFVYFLQNSRLSSAQRDLDAQETTNQSLQTKINGLQQFAQLQQAVSQKQAVVDNLLAQQILWSGVLRDLSLVIPGQLSLTSMNGILSAATTPVPGAPAGAAGSSTIVGNLQFQGESLDYPTVALWLTRLEEVKGWVNSWITTATKTDQNGVNIVQFSGSVDLTGDATVSGRPRP
jgi:Tfp pilus assembly protein PilN